MRKHRRDRWIGLLTLAFASGCLSTEPTFRNPHSPLLPTTNAVSTTSQRSDQDLVQVSVDAPAPKLQIQSLEEFVQSALANHPDLNVAATRVEAARGLMVQAGLYPNPMFGWMADEIGDREQAFGMQGPVASQRIVTAGKLRIAQAAAGFGVAAADWNAVTQRFVVITRVRTAYFDVLTAQRELKANEEIVRLAEEGLDVAKAAERAGTGARPDVLRADIELHQSRIRLTQAQQRAEAAWRLLATAIGHPTLPAMPLSGNLEQPPPVYAFEPVQEAVLHRSSEIHAAQTATLQAQEQLRRAQVEPIPDINIQLNPFYNFPQDRANLAFQVMAMIPCFDKNQGNIQAARAQLVQAGQMVKQTELQLTERLTAAFQRYETARRQKEAYEKQIIPQATESLRLVRIGYRAGDAKFDYTTVLQAQQTLAQARLAYVQTLGDLWRAASEIAGLLQLEEMK